MAGLLCAATLSTLTTAQGVHRFALDTVGSVHQIIENGMLTTDGHIVMQLDGPDYDILWKGQLDGTPIWQRRVAPEIRVIHPLTNGEILIMPFPTYSIEDQGDTATWDTARVDATLHVLDASGDIIRSTPLRWSYPVLSSGWNMVNRTSARTDALGNLFVLLGSSTMEGLRTLVIKFDQTGELQWARTPTIMFQQMWPDEWTTSQLLGIPDNLGGYYLAASNEYDPECTTLHINSLGELTWSRKVLYTNASSTLRMDELTTASNGDLLMLGAMTIPGIAMYNYFLRYPVDGAPASADLHSPVREVHFSQRSGVGGVLLFGNGRLRHLDNNGDLTEPLAFPSEQAQGSTYLFNPVGLGLVDGLIAIPGHGRSTHDIFGYQNWFPGAYTVDPAALPVDDCLVGPGGTVTRYMVPDSMLEVVDVEIILEAPILEITVGDSIAVETMTPIGTHDLCDFLTGVNEAAALNTPHVLNTLLTVGQPIQFAGEGPFLGQVLDAQGRLLSLGHLHGTGIAIATDGWPAGIHLVRMVASDGSWERTERVVLVH